MGQHNLDRLEVIHHGLDTVKQLYSGRLSLNRLGEIEALYEQGFGECIELGGHVWALGSGGKSGYQYRLQNSDLGLICFVKSRYAEKTDSASHLKIEASPHWLHPRSADQMGDELDALAQHFFDDKPAPAGVAVHLCADLQGWAPPANFQDTLVTRARRMVSHQSQNVLFMNMGEIASTFNQGQSYLIGSASTVQFAMYRKDIQAKATDKLDFWSEIWRSAPGESFDKPAYNPERPVWRLEFRFHHSVLAEFGRGAAQDMEYGFTLQGAVWAGIRGACKHLQGLWSYGLNSFRSEMKASKRGYRYYAPVWQFLLDSVQFAPPVGDCFYKRVKKTPGVGNEKNLMLALGNLLSVYARNSFNVARAYACIKASGIYDDLYNYFERRAYGKCLPFHESDIYQFIEKAINLRVLQGRAA
ncbi:hypothetical protein GO613_13910 [Azoarcus communis]|uniref:hypothetical protein n=1 Tax=Parazoarcus communis TaxID=41977 RepID=UPI0014591C30|nr:hypothetical protein [Parazoarcus communis]NMG49199.1 hypothetical protein [Parazoarcus communis]